MKNNYANLSGNVYVHTQEPEIVSNKRLQKHRFFGDTKPLDVVTKFNLVDRFGKPIFQSNPIVAPFYGQKNVLKPSLLLTHDFDHSMLLNNAYAKNVWLGTVSEVLQGVNSINRYNLGNTLDDKSTPSGLPLHRLFPLLPKKAHIPLIRKMSQFFSKSLPEPLNSDMVVTAYDATRDNVRKRPHVALYELSEEKKFLDYLQLNKLSKNPLEYHLTIPSEIVKDMFLNYEEVLQKIKRFGNIPTNYLQLLFKSNVPENK